MKEKKKAFGKKILSLVLTACMFATTLTPTLATIAYAQQMNGMKTQNPMYLHHHRQILQVTKAFPYRQQSQVHNQQWTARRLSAVSHLPVAHRMFRLRNHKNRRWRLLLALNQTAKLPQLLKRAPRRIRVLQLLKRILHRMLILRHQMQVSHPLVPTLRLKMKKKRCRILHLLM